MTDKRQRVENKIILVVHTDESASGLRSGPASGLRSGPASGLRSGPDDSGVLVKANQALRVSTLPLLPNSMMRALLPMMTSLEIRRLAQTSKDRYQATSMPVQTWHLDGADRALCSTREGTESLFLPCDPKLLQHLVMHNVAEAIHDKTWLPRLPALRTLAMTDTYGLPWGHWRSSFSLQDLNHLVPDPSRLTSVLLRFREGAGHVRVGKTMKKMGSEFSIVNMETLAKWLPTNCQEFGYISLNDEDNQGETVYDWRPLLARVREHKIPLRRIEIGGLSFHEFKNLTETLPKLESLRVTTDSDAVTILEAWSMMTKTWSTSLTELQVFNRHLDLDNTDYDWTVRSFQRLQVLQLPTWVRSLGALLDLCGELKELRRLSIQVGGGAA